MALPRCFYKYRSMLTAGDVARAKDILLNNRVYFAPAASFNDPFEGQVTISFNASPSEKLSVLRSYAIQTHGLELTAASEWANRVIENNIAEPEAHIHDELREAFRNGAGLYTLSERNDDILMWAHYADAHTGICIEFQPRTSVQIKWFEGAVPVKYQDDFPGVNYYERTPREENALAAMATKSSHWAYEKEWRLLAKNPGHNDLPEGVISGVIMGCNISPEHTRLVREWAASCSSPIDVYSARIKPGEYALEIALDNG